MTLKKLVLIGSLIFIGFILALNIKFILEDNLLKYFILTTILFILLYLCVSFLKIKDTYFIIALFLFCFLFKSMLVVFTYTEPTSDFSLFFNAARSVSVGDFSFANDQYFSTWAYQTGIVLYYGFLMKLLGVGLLPLLLINCAYMAGTNVFIYLIAKNYVDEKYARIAAVLYLFYPATYFLAPVLTNQHVSNFCIVWGIYLMLNLTKSKKAGTITAPLLMSGVLIAIGNIMRPQGIIIIASLVVLMVLNMKRVIKNKDFTFLKNGLVIMIVYFLINTSVSAIVSSTNINKNGLKNNYPLWKFVVGLNHETKGIYSSEDASTLFSVKDIKERDRLSKELIVERVSNPIGLLKLIYDKNEVMWSYYDNLEWGFISYSGKNIDVLGYSIPFNSISQRVLKFEKVFYVLVFLAAWLSIIKLLKRNQDNDFDALFFLVFILVAYMGMHSFIEIQPRYRDFAMIFVFVLSSAGLSTVGNFVKKFMP
ncbi:MAG: hypothetical protein GXY17_08485 [Clostridiaceae bacterium]|nr:hypothetical protein [Clostridiaceae bacterium]